MNIFEFIGGLAMGYMFMRMVFSRKVREFIFAVMVATRIGRD